MECKTPLFLYPDALTCPCLDVEEEAMELDRSVSRGQIW